MTSRGGLGCSLPAMRQLLDLTHASSPAHAGRAVEREEYRVTPRPFPAARNVCLLAVALMALLLGCDDAFEPSALPGGSSAGTETGPTPPNFRVAFLGDQGLGADAVAVLQLVKSEGARMVLHLGDFDYDDNPPAWEAQINGVLGLDFPYFAVVGNHDTLLWPAYRQLLVSRLDRIEGETCSDDYGVNGVCSFGGVLFVLSGAGTLGSGHAGYIRDALAQDASIWRVCAWHKNQTALQVGGKENDVGWAPYEECRKGGALIATAHEHSYSRTRTLSNLQSQTIDAAASDPNLLVVKPGSTFVFVSGLGGRSIRGQERCNPKTPPYGCGGIWASVYTSGQGARPGALFIDFNVDGDPRKARGYFKNVAGQVIDRFDVVAEPR